MKNVLLAATLLMSAVLADARGRGGYRGPNLEDKSKEQLVEILETHADPKMRSAAIYYLSRWGLYKDDAASHKALVKTMMHDAVESVRYSAAGALLAREEKASFKHLHAAMKDTKNSRDMRWSIANGIHKFGDPSVVPDLMEMLKTKEFRTGAANSLGELKVEAAIDPIVDMVLEHILHGEDGCADGIDHNFEIVVGAEALGNIGKLDGLRGVLPVLGQDTNYRRQVAMKAAGQIIQDRSTPQEFRNNALPLFIESLKPANEKDSSTRLEAVFALEHMNVTSADAIAGLKSACETDEDSRVRYAAFQYIVKIRAAGGCDPHKAYRDAWDRHLKEGGWSK